jgi:hypothetical protein
MITPFDADQWVEVNSSLIKAVGTKGDYLIVSFKKGGAVYRYPGLAFEFDHLIHAESVGSYFHKHVREQSCQRLRDEWPDE